MIVGKILAIDQVLDENPDSGSAAVPTELSLPFASRINKDLGRWGSGKDDCVVESIFALFHRMSWVVLT